MSSSEETSDGVSVGVNGGGTNGAGATGFDGHGHGHGFERLDDRLRDVVVVGGGPVGLLLACLLADRGIDVEVLERRTESSTHSRAIGIHPPGLRALELAGIGDAVRERATEIRVGRVTSGGRTLGAMAFDRVGAVTSLPQIATEALLVERLAALRPGALVRGVEARALHDRAGHAELDVRDTRATRDALGSGRRVRARYVIGADGVRSGIRSFVSSRWRERPGRGHYVMADTRPGGDPNVAMLHFEPEGVVESFPLPGGERRWVARVHADATGMTRQEFGVLVRGRVPGAEFDTDAASEPSAFLARQHLAERMTRGRVVLVGDAAHELSPIGGQGMNLGWLDAVHLAPELERALAAGGRRDAFGDYERVRSAAARGAVRQAAFNMSMGAPVGGVRLHARNAAVRALAVPPLSGVLARAFTMRWL